MLHDEPKNMFLVRTFNCIAEPKTNVQLNKSSLCPLSSLPYIHNIKSQEITQYIMACVGMVKEHGMISTVLTTGW